ncbi:MerR family transcriptional regulator [Leuconostoc carnosum]|uniref:MerR family transcriptional regulator n=1 Tax=Leuconostoc carnosum TaxID=1252 RepID=UPI00345DFB86
MNQESDLKQFKKPTFENMRFRIGELARMTGVSTRQLRYWEKQGYVLAIDRGGDNESRLYGLHAYVKVSIIKQHLDDGESLHDAVIAAEKQFENFMIIKQIVKAAFQGLEIDGDKSKINLGYFDDTETQWLYAYLEDDKIKYRLVDTANNECT